MNSLFYEYDDSGEQLDEGGFEDEFCEEGEDDGTDKGLKLEGVEDAREDDGAEDTVASDEGSNGAGDEENAEGTGEGAETAETAPALSDEQILSTHTRQIRKEITKGTKGKAAAGLLLCLAKRAIATNGKHTKAQRAIFRRWYETELGLSRHQAERIMRGYREHVQAYGDDFGHPVYAELVKIGDCKLDAARKFGKSACAITDNRVVFRGTQFGGEDKLLAEMTCVELATLLAERNEVRRTARQQSNQSPDDVGAAQTESTLDPTPHIQGTVEGGAGTMLGYNFEVEGQKLKPRNPSDDGLAVIEKAGKILIFHHHGSINKTRWATVPLSKWKEISESTENA